MTSTDPELFAAPRIETEELGSGIVLWRSSESLAPPAPSMAHLLQAGASTHPQRLLAAERDGEGWRPLTWGEAWQAARSVGQALLERGLGPHRPLLILSGNGLEHLLLLLGGYLAGVPVVPLSPSIARRGADLEQVLALARSCTAAMVFAADAEAYGPALDALAQRAHVRIVAGRSRVLASRSRTVGSHAGVPRPGAEHFDDLAATTPGAAVQQAFAALGPDTVAKIMFTSGSTGPPKGVLNTHRMLCTNQQAVAQVWPFLTREAPVLVDWLPWSHTFGGNHSLGQALAFGGTIYIDDGRPLDGEFDRSLAALREIRPTVYYNVPSAFVMLVRRLAHDRALADAFFSRLQVMMCAGATLSPAVWEQMNEIARAVAGREIPLLGSWGMTETGPTVTITHFSGAAIGCIGVPVPGVTLKLVACQQRHELRLHGPGVTPGYLGDPAASAAALDPEGFFRSGDSAVPVDPDDANRGLLFAGRLSENVKLASGTWVAVDRLRSALLSAADGVLADAVIVGEGRDYVGALAWLERSPTPPAPPQLAPEQRIRAVLADALDRLNEGRGSASRVTRLLLLDKAPQPGGSEITDKGVVKPRAVVRRYAGEVERLFAAEPDPDVIVWRAR